MNRKAILFTASVLTASLPFALSASRRAVAADSPARCYDFTTQNVPDMEANPAPRTERWCYQSLPGASGGMYIYNADYGKVKPELAMVKRPNGVLTHGSLAAGQISMHSMRYEQYNPFSVPLDEPSRLTASAPPANAEFNESAKNVLAMLLLAESPNPVSLTTVASGPSSGQASYQPWRGYWWPNKGMPILGPLRKFEAFAAARGRSLGTTAWESTHHVSHGLWWEGHCNGWAAAAILRPEPRSPFRDSVSGQTFSVSDQKGILTEADYCANAAMFGHRNDGGGDPNDVYPDVFHRTLQYYVGTLHKPIAIDYRRDAVVDNHIISGYSMNMVPQGNGRTLVTATLRMHQYDGSRSDIPGVARPYVRVYRYVLEEGGHGRWLGDNPDFLWVPLSTGRCSTGNPYMAADIVGGITR